MNIDKRLKCWNLRWFRVVDGEIYKNPYFNNPLDGEFEPTPSRLENYQYAWIKDQRERDFKGMKK